MPNTANSVIPSKPIAELVPNFWSTKTFVPGSVKVSEGPPPTLTVIVPGMVKSGPPGGPLTTLVVSLCIVSTTLASV